MYDLIMRNFLVLIFCLFTIALPAVATPADDREFVLVMHNGKIYEGHHQYRDALRCFEQGLRLKPDRWEPYNDAGSALIALDDCKGAIDVLTRGIKINPQQDSLYFLRSQAHMWMSQPKAALADLDRAIAIRPDYPVYCRRRAEAHETLGAHANAIRDCTDGIALCAPAKATDTSAAKPQNPALFDLLAQRGTIYQRTGKFQNAIDDYTEYLAAPKRWRGNALRVLQNRAECYDKLGKHDLAAKDRSAAANHKGDVLEDLIHDETVGTGR
jgi:tetratricopeptide (TPR) repeat protein